MVRSAEAGTISWESTREHLDLCLGCRACEPACPSNVHYGQILELAREKLEKAKPNRWRRMVVDGATSPAKLRLSRNAVVGAIGAAVAKKAAHGQTPPPIPASTPIFDWPELRDLPPVQGQVLLLEGCAMRELFPRVHQATRRLLRRAGFEVLAEDLGCCGALHGHAGYLAKGREMAARMRGRKLPIITNSAGCGSWLKENGVGAADLSEFLVAHPIGQIGRMGPIRVTYHDACHLAHGQRISREPRDLIRSLPGVELVEMNESDRCCGSAGTYNVFQPKMARRLLERKLDHIEGTGAEIVVMGNPGCHAWIAQGDPARRPLVLHLAELMEAVYSGVDPRVLGGGV